MKIESMVLGAVATNCYFAINEETKETIVIDPADRADVILKRAADEGLDLKIDIRIPTGTGIISWRCRSFGRRPGFLSTPAGRRRSFFPTRGRI